MGKIEFFTDEETDYYDYNKSVVCINGKIKKISGVLKRTLEFLIDNKGNLMTNTKIVEAVYTKNKVIPQSDIDRVRGHINALRNNIMEKKYGDELIQNVPGEGYMYVGPLQGYKKTEAAQTESPKDDPNTLNIDAEDHEVSKGDEVNDLPKKVEVNKAPKTGGVGAAADEEPVSVKSAEAFPYLKDLFDDLDKRIAELEQTSAMGSITFDDKTVSGTTVRSYIKKG